MDTGNTVAEDGAIQCAERKAFRTRRIAWGLNPDDPLRLGLALSGGGIRSATFSLGVLRELSLLGKLHRFDYLSTVSGGTYVGAFLCGLFVPRGQQPAIAAAGVDQTDPLGTNDATKAIGLLRQTGRYLAPTSGSDYWYAAVLLTRNWLGLHLAIGSTIFGVALVGVWLRALTLHWGPSVLPFPAFVSGLLATLAATLLAILVACGWAYWLTGRDVGTREGRGLAAQLGSLASVMTCLVLAIAFDGGALAWTVAGIGSLGLLFWYAGHLRTQRIAKATSWTGGPSAAVEEAWDTQRVRLTRLQAALATATAGLVACLAVDAIAFHIATSWGTLSLGAGSIVTVVLVPAARALLARSGSIRPMLTGVKRLVAGRVLVMLVALILLALTIGFWSVLAYLVTWPSSKEAAGPLQSFSDARGLLVATALMFIVVLAVSRTATFLNLSSLSTFYAGRLRRAYLGAGNRARHTRDVGVEVGEAGDEIQLIDYYENAPAGAPLHLINITLNETTGSGSSIVQRDRHGRNMTVGPAGISRTLPHSDDQVAITYADSTTEERLPLSTWIGISGAAFSTGLGSRTGFGLTTLAGLANVRLGYWWRAGPEERDHSVQAYLLNEFRGKFPGAEDRRWYLSDGGHFENTGVYELIRRKLPFILACDNGQDEAYAYEDVANLVRKARIDFGANISFLDAAFLDANLGRDTKVRRAFGTLAQVGGGEPPEPGAVAALATVSYYDGTWGTLILVKPRLTGDGPADLLRYRTENSTFPQQTTLDQFFDEAQWESYYVLGRHIIRSIMSPADGKWNPADLKPITR